MISALFLLTASHGEAVAQTFTVNSNGDDPDATLDGTCDTGQVTSSGAPECTLRAAMQEANDGDGAGGQLDVIEFSIGTSSVINTSSLPEITDPVVIDGETAPLGAIPRIRIDGGPGDGLVVKSGGTTLRGLQILRFQGNGIVLDGGDENVITNCQIGDFVTQSDQPAGYANGGHGILITNGSTLNRIGSQSDSDDRNIISGNGGSGIRIDGGAPGQTNNTIGGNYIGVAADGETDLGNAVHGIHLLNSTSSNAIGSAQTGDLPNVISGNNEDGIHMDGDVNQTNSTSNNSVSKNIIGLSASQSKAIQNGKNGISIDGANHNTIGSTLAAPVVIAGNGEDGVEIYGEDITVQASFIGVNDSGTIFGNAQEGISTVGGSANLTIGASSSASANIIGGNQRGIRFFRTTGSEIMGNFIGVTRQDAAIGNTFYGIGLFSSASNVIGGTGDEEHNVVSGNGSDGIVLSGAATQDNQVIGNRVGTNDAADALIGNGDSGILIDVDANDNQIGGAAAGEGNVLAGNNVDLYIKSSNNAVEGNYFETNANADDLSTSSNSLRTGPNAMLNAIGGTTSGTENVFGYTPSNVIRLLGSFNIVGGNYIGVHPNGTAMPVTNGIVLEGNSQVVGTTNPGAGNTIANVETGVRIDSGTGHMIRGNSMSNVGTLGIDIDSDGSTANDAGDADDGTNRLQNAPTISDGDYDSGANEISVTYSVNSDPSLTGSGASTYPLMVDFYIADGTSPVGRTYIGTDKYEATDYSGCGSPPCTATVTFTPSVAVSDQDFLVGVTVDDVGNTSEFSTPPDQLPVELASFDVLPTDGRSARITWQTLSEKNNDRFEIEHQAPDATSFVQAGTVEGAGTTTQPESYSLTLDELEVGTHTFRLRQIDVDGTATVLGERTIKVSLDTAFELSLGPNPVRSAAKGTLVLQDAQTVRATMYDVLGREVQVVHDGPMKAGQNDLSLDASALGSGRYFLRINGESFSTTESITVVR
ncbi:hypothetical protein CRI94_16780 [Longibacter salinarum]|uniref:Secretion system C-terminal sorting domain-containing protein n=1 Tax=Longibacter salinarum TaxID=1850348 RepID=A0A2A8CTR0_9BACT|nr:hypothetical protein CRI94_16780 [Longibacter salinarum]